MVNVGDKFVIEIGDIFEQEGEKLYRIKGFKSLVFDENGLKKLVPPEEAANVNMEAARYAGRAEVWQLAEFLYNTKYGEIKKIFDVPDDATYPIEWILNRSVNNMIYKYKEWKKSENEIKVGDVVKHKNGFIGVVTETGSLLLEGITEKLNYFYWYKVDCTKTGKHIDIESIISEIKEDR